MPTSSESELGRLLRALHNSEQPLPTVAALAAESGITARALLKRWLARYGCAPREWLASLAMTRADSLLSDPDLDLATIAACCGYTRPQHFITAYKRRRGCTPGAVRGGKSASE